jgi:lysophospholipase L1-like esterase
VIQPSLVIVYFGGNDSTHPHPSGHGPHVPLSEFIENMRKIGEHLLSLSDKTRVIFLTPPPMNEKQIEIVFGYMSYISVKCSSWYCFWKFDH